LHPSGSVLKQILVVKGHKHMSQPHPKFSFWVGVCFTLNYVVGSGFLTLPWAFQKTGPLLGVLILAVFSYFSIIAVCFILEASDRAVKLDQALHADGIELRRKVGTKGYESINSTADEHSGGTALVMSDDSVHNESFSKKDSTAPARRIEMTELCGLFMGKTAKQTFSYLIGIYMYGTLWAYCTVFANAFSTQLPFGEGLEEVSYLSYLALFALLVIPLSLMELSEQIYVQVTLTIFRAVMLSVMIITTGSAYFRGGYDFGEESNEAFDVKGGGNGTDIYDVNFGNVYLFLPIAAYAYIFHHSVPALADPVEDKKSLTKMFAIALVISFVAYALLGVVVALYFGDKVDSSSNLNWREYQGPRTSDGSIPWYASLVAFFVVLFPALDVASAYPLNAFTLGNNLMSAFYGDEMYIHEKSEAKVRTFRLLAAAPPFLGACLVRDLSNITSFTGLTGFAIAFIVPSMLAVYSARKMNDRGLSEETVHSNQFTTAFAQYMLTSVGILLVVGVAISQAIALVHS